MSAATKLSYYTPNIFAVTPSRLHSSLKPIVLQTPILLTSSPEKRRVLVWGHRRSGRNMAADELTRLPGIRSSGDGESFEIMEDEARLSNGSSEFGAHVVTGGLEYTMNKMSKWLVSGIFCFLILWKHDTEALWPAVGGILNAWLSIALKQVFNQERPYSTSKSDPGMPSSHSQSIFFAVVYAILSMINYLGLNKVSVTVGVFALAFGSYLAWLRVAQKHHTISQVSVGAIIGTVFSILWFQAWYAFVLKAFIASLWVRIFVVTGSVMSCVYFLVYVIQHWLREEL